LVTAGPTYEPIDPVRFIGNRSSGKMGYAIAEVLAEKGADVILVSGPVAIQPKHVNIRLVKVETASEMYVACMAELEQMDIGIYAAAVSDYTPKQVSESKIKKQENELVLELVKTKDILKEMGRRKKASQILVGFALETDNEEANAQEKVTKKNLDFVVLNSLNDQGAGFATDTNKITIIDKYNIITKFELKEKRKVAEDIVDYLTQFIDV
jgi:phosphopantothenoylcysteine decarboxylase/phosphopantothenate--cysteine ligase